MNAPVFAGARAGADPDADAEAAAEAERTQEALDDELLEWTPEESEAEASSEPDEPGLAPPEPDSSADPSPGPGPRPPGFGRNVRPDEWSIRWRNGFRLRRNDKRYDLHFGGLLQGDAAFFHLDDGLRPRDSGWDSEADVRRARLFAQGIIVDRLLFKVDYEISESEFRDVFVGLRGLPWLGTVKAGYLKEPFSLEQTTSSRFNTFMERSLANALVPRRNSGILATNTLLDGRLRWEAGAFWVVDNFRENDSESRGFDNDWDLTFRVTGLPVYRKDGSQLLLAGLSYSHRFSDEEDVSYRTRPEARLVDTLIGTPNLTDVRNVDTVGLELAWVDGSWSAQSEWIVADVSRGDGKSDYTAWGGYLQASRFLTGERRVYGKASGRWGRVVPVREFDWGQGALGAFEVAARLSHLDLDDGDVRGGRETNLTFATSWYPLSNVRLALNLTWAHVSGDGDAAIAQTRLQVDF